MSAALLLTGLFLALFGIAFLALGLMNERSYWAQRDPSAAPGSEGVRLATMVRQAWPLALRGKRPSLRIGGIGVILVVLGVVFAVAGLIAR
jgi:hypothetical protein